MGSSKAFSIVLAGFGRVWKVQDCFGMQLQASRVFHGLGGFQLEGWSAVDGMTVSERSGLRWIALGASFLAV